MEFIAELEVPGTEIGKYRLVAELARGGMGNVYLAVVQGPGGFNKLVAVKELKPEFYDDDMYVTMFMEEGRLAAQLTHPNIVQTYDVGSDGHRHFMIMEYLDGRTFYRIGKKLSEDESLYDSFPLGAQLRIISEALVGLHHAHELCDFQGQSLGIVHRDVSPLNVFVTFDGQTKVLDFGIAKMADSALETQTGILKGRVAYMAPEQACGDPVDRRADVYSAGVMIWEAAAGRRLWPKMSDVEVLIHVLREGPPSLRAVCPDAPLELDAICARAMAREVGDRYPTAAALVHDLDAYLRQRADAMPMREIGALIGRSFESERRKTSAMIEEAIVRLRDNPQSAPLATLNRTSGTQTVSSVRGQRNDRGSLPSLLAQTPSSDASLRVADADRSPAVPDADSGAIERPDARHSAIEGPRARAPLGWFVAATAACLVSGALALVMTRRVNPSSSWIPVLTRPVASIAAAAPAQPALESTAAAPAPAAAPIPSPVEADRVDVLVRVAPSGAQIAIDGVVVRGNPYHTRTERDRRVHRVVAQADGYDSKVEEVPFADDITIDINLERRPPPVRPLLARGPAAPGAVRSFKVPFDGAHGAPPAAPERPVAPAASPSASATAATNSDPAGGRLPLRPVVAADPYASP